MKNFVLTIENKQTKRSVFMKNFVLTVVVLTLFIGCSQPDDSVDNSPKTILKIRNESPITLSNIRWQDTDFGNLSPGKSSTKEFSIATDLSGYIYFKKGENSDTAIDCRTQQLTALKYKDIGEFTFTDNTVVIDMGDSENVQALVSIVLRKGTVKIIAGPQFASQNSFNDIKLQNIQTGAYYSSNGGYLSQTGDTVSIIVPVGYYTLIGTQRYPYYNNTYYYWSNLSSEKTSNTFPVAFNKATSITLKVTSLHTTNPTNISLYTEFTISEPQ
jgi:hypothetical protein